MVRLHGLANISGVARFHEALIAAAMEVICSAFVRVVMRPLWHCAGGSRRLLGDLCEFEAPHHRLGGSQKVSIMFQDLGALGSVPLFGDAGAGAVTSLATRVRDCWGVS